MGSYNKTMSFYRTNAFQTGDNDDWKINFKTRSPITFGSSYIVSYFVINFNGAIRSNTYVYDTKSFKVCIKVNGKWEDIWDGSLRLGPRDKQVNATIEAYLPQNLDLRKRIAAYGVTEIKLEQDEGASRIYADEGSLDSTITFTYWDIEIPAPTKLQINGGQSYTGQTAPLTWESVSSSSVSAISYEIFVNNVSVKSSINTNSYTIPETTASQYTTASTIFVKATGDGFSSPASNNVVYTYQPAFTKRPEAVKVNKVSNAVGPTATVSWNEAKISNNAAITYEIYNNNTRLAHGITDISYTFQEDITKDWEGVYLLSVRAISSGIDSWSSDSATYQYKPTFDPPSNLTINDANTYTGNIPTLKWTNATISNGAAIKYHVYIAGEQFIEVQKSPYTIAEESTIKNLQGAQKIKIGASAGNWGTVYSNEVTFTYSSNLTPPSNLRINNTTGQTAKLTWDLATLSSGNKITYCIYKNDQLIKEVDGVNTYTFDENITSNWGLDQVSLQVSAKGDGKESAKTNLVNYAYRPIFTIPIKNLKISGGVSYQGQTVELIWEAASISNNSIIEYSIYKNDELIDTTQNTLYTIEENITKEWQNTNLLKVIASSSGITSTSNSVEYTYLAKFTMPTNLTINNSNSYVGHSINLNWNASTLSNEKPISYSIRKNGQEIATTDQTSYSFNEETIFSWKEKKVIIFSIVAKGDNRTVNGANEVSFIYKPSYKTIKFYHKDLGWKECIVFRHNGIGWVRCDPYYYYDNDWQLSDHWKSPQ